MTLRDAAQGVASFAAFHHSCFISPHLATPHRTSSHPAASRRISPPPGAISPLFHIDAITAPLLIGQGANDPRVKQEPFEEAGEGLRLIQSARRKL